MVQRHPVADLARHGDQRHGPGEQVEEADLGQLVGPQVEVRLGRGLGPQRAGHRAGEDPGLQRGGVGAVGECGEQGLELGPGGGQVTGGDAVGQRGEVGGDGALWRGRSGVGGAAILAPPGRPDPRSPPL
ncbi:MAG: hypothetical protein ACK559_11385, partial [bacterium]